MTLKKTSRCKWKISTLVITASLGGAIGPAISSPYTISYNDTTVAIDPSEHTIVWETTLPNGERLKKVGYQRMFLQMYECFTCNTKSRQLTPVGETITTSRQTTGLPLISAKISSTGFSGPRNRLDLKYDAIGMIVEGSGGSPFTVNVRYELTEYPYRPAAGLQQRFELKQEFGISFSADNHATPRIFTLSDWTTPDFQIKGSWINHDITNLRFEQSLSDNSSLVVDSFYSNSIGPIHADEIVYWAIGPSSEFGLNWGSSSLSNPSPSFNSARTILDPEVDNFTRDARIRERFVCDGCSRDLSSDIFPASPGIYSATAFLTDIRLDSLHADMTLGSRLVFSAVVSEPRSLGMLLFAFGAIFLGLARAQRIPQA